MLFAVVVAVVLAQATVAFPLLVVVVVVALVLTAFVVAVVAVVAMASRTHPLRTGLAQHRTTERREFLSKE